ncbi:hypothetical protein I204_07985 [Kwoniella mangroviensis CBS 8886]|nr:hypothetical protein I204_07985 [Kwoniella mangroviensis CBS 8886]
MFFVIWEVTQVKKDLEEFRRNSQSTGIPKLPQPKFRPPLIISDKPTRPRPYDLFDYLEDAKKDTFKRTGRCLPIVSSPKYHHKPTETVTEFSVSESHSHAENDLRSKKRKSVEHGDVKVRMADGTHKTGDYRMKKKLKLSASSKNKFANRQRPINHGMKGTVGKSDGDKTIVDEGNSVGEEV